MVSLKTEIGMCWAEWSLWQHEYWLFRAESMLSISHKGKRDHTSNNSLLLFYQFPVQAARAEDDTTL